MKFYYVFFLSMIANITITKLSLKLVDIYDFTAQLFPDVDLDSDS